MNEKYAIVDVETTGLNAMFDRIIAIGVKGEDFEKVIVNESEKEMLEQFWNFLEEKKVDILVGFNFEFDWQFLKLRSLKHRVKIIHYKKQEQRKDIRIILNSDKYAKGTRLHDYLRFFGIENGDKYDGSLVPYFYKTGQIEKIKEHLLKDIRSEFQLYKLLVECGVV